MPAPSLAVWSSILVLGLVCTSLAYIIYFRLIANVGATNASLVTYLIPASAIILGAVFFGETLEVSHFAGLACILLGLALVGGRLFERPARSS